MYKLKLFYLFSVNSSSHDYYLSPTTNTSVVITSPGYPHGYASKLNVTWTIHTDPQHHIEIEFLYLDLFSAESFIENLSFDYIKVETGKALNTFSQYFVNNLFSALY